MCSVGNEVEDDGALSTLMSEGLAFNNLENKCIKCKLSLPTVVLHSKYPYCKECFIAATTHKFKALLGKHRVIKFNDKVLIWHRTGHASSALLHFLRAGLDLKTPKKIKFSPIILFIEDHYNLPVNERINVMKNIDEEVKRFEFPIYYISLSEYTLTSKQEIHHLNIHEDYEKICVSESDIVSLKNNFQKNPTKTVLKETIKILQRQILIGAAKHLKCSTIFIPDLGIDVASQLLTSISLGRGAHVVYDTGTIDSRDEEVNILRPLRNFTIKELALYNHFHNIQTVAYIAAEENHYTSVQGLISRFVSDLQVNYPATVSTVVRTGDKLSMDTTGRNSQKCSLCAVPIVSKHDGFQSIEATNFSHWVSTNSPNHGNSSEEQADQIIHDFRNTEQTKYCFSCNQISDYLL